MVLPYQMPMRKRHIEVDLFDTCEAIGSHKKNCFTRVNKRTTSMCLFKACQFVEISKIQTKGDIWLFFMKNFM